ncbi:MAG: orotidine 5'-phosphate decarboxylase / HUMPS family protein, partial [Halieaceae bacterium]
MADVGPKIIVAMDFSSSQAALRLADQLDPKMVRLKVGKQLFTSAGPSVVTALRDLGVGGLGGREWGVGG